MKRRASRRALTSRTFVGFQILMCIMYLIRIISILCENYERIMLKLRRNYVDVMQNLCKNYVETMQNYAEIMRKLCENYVCYEYYATPGS